MFLLDLLLRSVGKLQSILLILKLAMITISVHCDPFKHLLVVQMRVFVEFLLFSYKRLSEYNPLVVSIVIFLKYNHFFNINVKYFP